MLGASTSHGFQVTPFLYLGVGIAANDVAWKEGSEDDLSENDGIIAPVFGDVRLDLWNRGRLSPFVDIRGGYDFICKNGLYLSSSIYIFVYISGRSVSIMLTDRLGEV